MKNFIEIETASSQYVINVSSISHIRKRKDGKGEIVLLSTSNEGKATCISSKQTYEEIKALIQEAL